MKELIKVLSTLKFRYSIVIILLGCLMTFIFTVLFMPDKKLTAQMWQFISGVEGFFVGVLTTAITFYFTKKNDNHNINSMPTIISNEQSSCRYNNTQDRNINI